MQSRLWRLGGFGKQVNRHLNICWTNAFLNGFEQDLFINAIYVIGVLYDNNVLLKAMSSFKIWF